MLRLLIDPGHGGNDPGAVNPIIKVYEKDINLMIASSVNQKLIDAGHLSQMTRTKDQYVPLGDRVTMANKLRLDAFVSIHCNAAQNKQAKGMEIWTSPGKTKADVLSDCIGEELMKAFANIPMRCDYSDGDLDKESRLYVLTKTLCPAVLIECGFISNNEEALRLKEPSTVEAITEAISIGIQKWEKG